MDTIEALALAGFVVVVALWAAVYAEMANRHARATLKSAKAYAVSAEQHHAAASEAWAEARRWTQVARAIEAHTSELRTSTLRAIARAHGADVGTVKRDEAPS